MHGGLITDYEKAQGKCQNYSLVPLRRHVPIKSQGIEKVMIQLKDTPTKVYARGAKLLLSKVPLEVLQI